MPELCSASGLMSCARVTISGLVIPTAWEEPGSGTIPKTELFTAVARADTAGDAYLPPVLPARARLRAARGAVDADHRAEPVGGLPHVRRAARGRAGHQPVAARPAAGVAGAVRGDRAGGRARPR